MKIRTLGALGLMVVGVGAAVFVTVGPTIGASGTSTRYLTTRAAVADVISQVAATGSVAAADTYSLAFGSAATTTATTATSSSTSSASSSGSTSGSSSGSGSESWTVKDVNVTVGQAVKAGDVLATSDTTSAQVSLAIAQANLASAQSRLKTDKAGPTALDRSAAKVGIAQASQSLTSARNAYSQTVAQNNLKVSQARTAVTQADAAVTQAKDQLASDTTAKAAQNVLAQDKNAVTQAENAVTQAANNLASTRLSAGQAASQAANQISSARIGVTSANYAYKQKVIATPASTISSDQAAVIAAQQTVTTDKQTIADANLIAPADGIVTAVNVTPGSVAPSGAAITLRSAAMQVSGTIPEASLPSLKLGQTANVTLTALASTETGTVAEIDQAGTPASSGGVVTYGFIVALPTPPAGTAPGMSAQVSVVTNSATGVLSVPAIALQSVNGQYTVRVLDANGVPQAVPVQVGLVTSSLAQITSGIDAGTAVVVGTTSARQGTTTTTTGIGGLGGGGFGGGGFGGGGTFTRGGGTGGNGGN